MEKQCHGGQCHQEKQSNSCHSQAEHAHHQHKEKCCPVEMKAELLEKAFMKAMFKAHVSSMKKIIEEKLGDKIDATSRLAVDYMMSEYKAKLLAGKNKHEALNKLKDFMFQNI